MTELLAPNGKPSNLNAEQYELVRTPDFKGWFGFWDLYPYGKAKDYYDPSVRKIAKELKEEKLSAINEAVDFLSQQVTENDVLIPMPSRYGIATDTRKLAQEISDKTGAKLFDCLIGRKRDSIYEMKQKNQDVSNFDFQFQINCEIPKAKNYFIVDNVIGTGVSMKNALKNVIKNVGNNVSPLVYAIDLNNISKVVDENGEPLVCYHGTTFDFNIFEKTIFGKFGKGMYFTSYIDFAKKYAKNYDESRIIPVFLKSINLVKTGELFKDQIKNLPNDYDGIWSSSIWELDYDYEYEIEEDEIIVYSPEQIKLADGTNTTFDGNNPDIRFDEGGLTYSEVETRVDDFLQWFENNGWKELSQEEVINAGLGNVDDYFWIEGYTFQSPDKNVLLQFTRQARYILDKYGVFQKIYSRYRDKEPIIMLDTLLVKEKGKGEGTKAIKLITELADKFGVILHLYSKPIPKMEYLNNKELFDFYKKAGFEVLKENEIQQIMVYNPDIRFDGGGKLADNIFDYFKEKGFEPLGKGFWGKSNCTIKIDFSNVLYQQNGDNRVWVSPIEYSDYKKAFTILEFHCKDKNKGIGTALLKEIIQGADLFEYTIFIEPTSMNKYLVETDINTNDLKRWYSKYDFKPLNDNYSDNVWLRNPKNPNIRFNEGGEVIINPTEIECHKCHWHWKVKDGGDDLFICHKCYTDNSKYYMFEGLEGQKILDTISFSKGGGTMAKTYSPNNLYHFTSLDALKGILQAEYIEGYEGSVLDEEEGATISTTTDKDYRKKQHDINAELVILLNKDEIVKQYEVLPIRDYGYEEMQIRKFLKQGYSQTDAEYMANENQEIIKTEKLPIDYIDSIIFFKSPSSQIISLLESKNISYTENDFKKGGRTIAQTPAPKKERIYGSEKNKPESSKDTKSAEKIEFNEKTLETIKNKVAEHNENNPKKKVTLASAKAVVRRGMGAYSSTHRPTISGGKPNSRVAWGLARLNAFFYKIINGKSKSGKYSQDDDLINELGYKVAKFENGGDVQAYEDALNITFNDGGETKPKKVYVSIQFDSNIEKIPNTFNEYFTTYSEKTFEELKNRKLKGVVGVSSSPNNIAEWFILRDCLIVMNYDEFMAINDTEIIDYSDPYQLMKNNLFLFKRLYANISRYGEQENVYRQTLVKILEKVILEINLELNISQGEKAQELYRIARFLSPYNTRAFPEWMEKNSIKIESPIDLTIAILDFNKIDDSWLGVGFKNPVLTFDELLPVIEKGVTNASKIYESEQEIFLTNRELNIPEESQLFFIGKDELNQVRQSNQRDLIEKYNLKELYKIYFVDRVELEKYRSLWYKKQDKIFQNNLEKGKEQLELKKDQVLEEIFDYFLQKSLNSIKSEVEKYILDYSESLEFYDETIDDSVELNWYSIPIVESIFNTYILIVTNFWKSFIQKKQVKNLDIYAFSRFQDEVRNQLKTYFSATDELEKLYNYRNTRGSVSLDAYLFERLFLKSVDDYENLPEWIDYKELAQIYLDKMGRELYRYYTKEDIQLISKYDEGGQTDEPNEFWGKEAGGVLVYCSTTNRYLILLRSDWVLEPNTWGIISGKLDEGENVKEAVLRESEEETGHKLGTLIPSFIFEKENFKFYNFVSIIDEEFEPKLNWENSDYKWVELNDMPENLHFGLKLLLENENIENLIEKNKNMIQEQNPKDTITMDIPLLIRFSELMREDVKSDVELHKIIDNLIDMKDKGVLNMDDYEMILEKSVEVEEKMENGGKVQTINSKKGDIKISLDENWYDDDTSVELVPVSELIKFREFDRKVSPKYNQDNSRDNIQHLKYMFQKEGVRSPLIIEYSAEDNSVLIIEGNHRLNSAIDLGMEYLPARVILRKFGKFSPSKMKNTMQVAGIQPNESNYIPSDLKPSQVGIANTKPISFGDGGIIEGRLHSECGDDGCGRKFQVGENGHLIEAERDEAVIVADAFDDNQEYTIEGTPSEVASALNVMGGGKSFDRGAVVIKNGEELEIPQLKTQASDTDVDDVIDSGSIIINRRSMADDKEYKVTGTPKQIASAINSINGNGVVIEKGAEIKEN